MKEIIDCSVAKNIETFYLFTRLYYYNPNRTDCRIYIFSLVQCVFVILINLQIKVIFLCHVINYIL